MKEPTSVTHPGHESLTIELHNGSREELRPLFELAEDSAQELDGYLEQGHVLVARQHGDILGHLQLTIDEVARVAEIKNMAVAEHAQRSGIGTKLVRAGLALARERGAERVRVATAAADTGNLRFYQRQGFRLAAVERDVFTASVGYAPGTMIDGVELRDRVWLDLAIASSASDASRTHARTTRSGRLSDREVVDTVARRLSVPRESVASQDVSFVLHAPLELLARATLLPAVAIDDRDRARRRMLDMVERYERSGPALATDCGTTASAVHRNTSELLDALGRRDGAAADCAAHHLDTHASTAAIARSLAATALPALAAAGHANIYLGLLARRSAVSSTTTMLRSLARSLVTDDAPPMPVPSISVESEITATPALLDLLTELTPVGPPRSPFIAPLVAHAFHEGLVERMTPDGTFRAPPRGPKELLRLAAQGMLQGDPDQAPFGWTHALTLAQGALRAGTLAGNEPLGTYVAMVYLVAHWGAYGIGTLDPDHVPAPTPHRLRDALHRSPDDAAAAAWHDSDRVATATMLASSASSNHDAHRVKYTLACLDAAAEDPPAEPLYLAAAAYLNSWWELRGDPDDPWN